MRKFHHAWLLALGISAVFGAQAQSSKAETPLPASIQEIINNRCALCHGSNGQSASAVYPRLAAQHPEYLQKQLRDFRDGRRKSDTMSDMARNLTDDEIAALANFFGSRKASARQSVDPELAEVGKYIFNKGNRFSGVAACASCHGSKGLGTDSLPRLAGQHPSYIEVQLKEFNQRERTNDNSIMHSIASKLTELETKAVSAYIGSLQ